MKTKRIPFDIEKAKNGAKVITRDGCSVKRLFYDIEHKSNDYPILAYVREDEEERTLSFTELGQHVKCGKSQHDLFIEEEVEETDDYDPYKATVESIADMVEKYADSDSDLQDFYDNVKVQCKDAVAYEKKWLEKQGKQKTADNKSKFHKGDWVIDKHGMVQQITDVRKNIYKPIYEYSTISYSLGILSYGSFSENVKDIRLWNIKDAKDGDVLYSGEVIFIFNRIKGEWIHCYCTLHRDGSFISENYDLMHIKHCKEVQPATKEQYDLLFQKMKEAGYEWDSDKKELHKIEESKTRLMTHQELADWLRDAPEEHREYRYASIKDVYSTYDYPEDEANTPVDESIITIRRNHGEWHKPLIEE